MSTTTDPSPDVPLPAGAGESSGGWIDRDETYPLPYRIAYCHRYDTTGLMWVEGSAIQLNDGRVDGEIEPPKISVYPPEMFSTAAARQLAAALIEIADQLDQWVTSTKGHTP
ncbi:hypothetical protein AWB92_26685 [Mycobacterium sp. IEC1808]|uniref:hypothetical protein n=1 Tax=Mycobacterium sp. IEC1808 TaxID=1743230 RepID=UPI000A16BA7A|nr:hypothetical protein [Mycobacterium sp. IEC1808]ORW85967.1 hypothetical protein AWB92_26685 [Mycobacterium sp. IEC1808]